MGTGKTTSDVKRVIKIPLVIDESDPVVRSLKYRIVTRAMEEARYIGNEFVRLYIAYDWDGCPKLFNKSGKEVCPQTRAYGEIKCIRKILDSTSFAGMNHMSWSAYSKAKKMVVAGKKGWPCYKSLILPLRYQTISVKESAGEEGQYKVSVNWMRELITDGMIVEFGKKLNRAEKKPKDLSPSDVPESKRGISFVTIISGKDVWLKDQVEGLATGKLKLSDSVLKERIDAEGKVSGFMLFVPVLQEEKVLALDPNRILGVDLGCNVPAMVATNFDWSREKFGNRESVDAMRNKYRALRRRKQAANMVEGHYDDEISRKEGRAHDSMVHEWTSGIVKFAQKKGCGVVRLEDLSSLRAKQMVEKGEYSKIIWTPGKVRSVLEYKCEAAGIKVEMMNPRNTSRRCPKCGHVSADNRKSQSYFECVECGYHNNADYVAARNIATAEGSILKDGYSGLEDLELKVAV